MTAKKSLANIQITDNEGVVWVLKDDKNFTFKREKDHLSELGIDISKLKENVSRGLNLNLSFYDKKRNYQTYYLDTSIEMSVGCKELCFEEDDFKEYFCTVEEKEELEVKAAKRRDAAKKRREARKKAKTSTASKTTTKRKTTSRRKTATKKTTSRRKTVKKKR